MCICIFTRFIPYKSKADHVEINGMFSLIGKVQTLMLRNSERFIRQFENKRCFW